MAIKRHYVFAVFSCLIAAGSFGGVYIVMQSALLHLDAVNITTMRFLVCAFFLAIILLVFQGTKAFNTTKKQFIILLILGSLGSGGSATFVAIAQHIIGKDGSVQVAIIFASSPILSLLLVCLFNRKCPSIVTYFCVFFSLIGIILFVTKGNIASLFNNNSHPLANILVVIAALNFVIYSMGIKIKIFQGWSPMRYTTISIGLGSIVTLIVDVFLIIGGKLESPNITAMIAVMPHILYMGVLAGVVGLLLWGYGNQVLSSVNAILFINFSPVVTVVVATFLGSKLSTIQIIGIIVTIVALTFNSLNQIREQKKLSKAKN